MQQDSFERSDELRVRAVSAVKIDGSVLIQPQHLRSAFTTLEKTGEMTAERKGVNRMVVVVMVMVVEMEIVKH